MEKTVRLWDGTQMPKLGQGTWYVGDDSRTRAAEIEALQTGIALGTTLIDTAEMYGSGRSEKLIGEAIRGQDRNGLFLVSKVYPHNAGRDHIFTSCENSLKRLGTDYLDLYLLHWRGSIPFGETVDCMEELVKEGKIRRWGVSNLDTDDMEELLRVKNGEHCSVNQVLYHLGSRGVEFELLPKMKQWGIPLMAYCPVAQAGRLRNELLGSSAVKETAQKHGVTPMQVLLAWVLRQDFVIPIPKAGNPAHTRQNAAAWEVGLDEMDMNLLDQAFPAPRHKVGLDMQ